MFDDYKYFLKVGHCIILLYRIIHKFLDASIVF
jgi:hypothetical protein